MDENAELIAREGGKPLKWATVEATRAVSTFRWASEVIRHGDDEVMRLDTEQSLGSRIGLLRRFPIGPVLGITPFNFPLEPGGAQGGALPGRRRAHRREAGQLHTDRLAATGGVLRRDGPAQGDVSGPSGALEGRRSDGTRRSLPQDQLHGLGGRGLVPQGPRSQETRDARARRQRGGHRARRRRPRPRRAAHRVRRLLPGGAELHQRAARAGVLRDLRRVRHPAHEAGGAAEDGRPDGSHGRRRPGHRPRRGRPDRGVGQRGGRPGRRAAHRRHGRRSVLHAHPHLADHAGDEGAMRGGVRPGRHDQPVRDVRRRAPPR